MDNAHIPVKMASPMTSERVTQAWAIMTDTDESKEIACVLTEMQKCEIICYKFSSLNHLTKDCV